MPSRDLGCQNDHRPKTKNQKLKEYNNTLGLTDNSRYKMLILYYLSVSKSTKYKP